MIDKCDLLVVLCHPVALWVVFVKFIVHLFQIPLLESVGTDLTPATLRRSLELQSLLPKAVPRVLFQTVLTLMGQTSSAE